MKSPKTTLAQLERKIEAKKKKLKVKADLLATKKKIEQARKRLASMK